MRQSNIQVVGTLALNIVPHLLKEPLISPGTFAEVGSVEFRLGGPVANVSRVMRQLGSSVHMVACIGDDELGDTVRRLVQNEFECTYNLSVVAGCTTSYSVVIQAPGVDRAIWHHIGANATFDGSSVDPCMSEIIHLGYPAILPKILADDAAGLRRLFDSAKGVGVTTSLDLSCLSPRSFGTGVNWHSLMGDLLPRVDIMSPSLDDLCVALGISGDPPLKCAARAAEYLIDCGAAVAMVTAGPAGFALCAGSETRIAESRLLSPVARTWAETRMSCPAKYVYNAQTGGAGDSATAGLLFGLLAGLPPRHVVGLVASIAGRWVSGSRFFDPFDEVLYGLSS
ncbi:carbohydrate kinase family protein [Umezawaea sp. NPDC059074]|uniref:carbohydrate kinase family protein n=1 Tax=Umezawaea sp. NPDC059074 TaxID=3346716 RepID=UPI00368051CA